MKRTITKAILKDSRERIDVADYFRNRQAAHEERLDFDSRNSPFECPECEQDLMMATSEIGTIHLKHYPKSDFCILKTANITEEYAEEIQRITLHKGESERHKELKRIICEKLKRNSEVKEIVNDTKWLKNADGEKAKPDVYCEYNNRKLVFEIQYSSLSQRYVNYRQQFYSSLGIYLIWILDGVNIHRQEQYVKDIKYQNSHQNIFFLAENFLELTFKCYYKEPFVSNTINSKGSYFREKWIEEFVPFTEIEFMGAPIYEPYYYEYETVKEYIIQLCDAKKEREKIAQHEKRNVRSDLIEINKTISIKEKELGTLKREYNRFELEQSKLKEQLDNTKIALEEILKSSFNPYYSLPDFIKSLPDGIYPRYIELRNNRSLKSKEIEMLKKEKESFDNFEKKDINGKEYCWIDPDLHRRFIARNKKEILVYRREDGQEVYPKNYAYVSFQHDLWLAQGNTYFYLFDANSKISKCQTEIDIKEKELEVNEKEGRGILLVMEEQLAVWLKNKLEDLDQRVLTSKEDLGAAEIDIQDVLSQKHDLEMKYLDLGGIIDDRYGVSYH